MQGERHPAKIALRDARENAIDRLTRAFVADEVSLEEFESAGGLEGYHYELIMD